MSSGSSASISYKEEVLDYKPLIFQFRYYNSLSAFIAPIYLMKYSYNSHKKI